MSTELAEEKTIKGPLPKRLIPVCTPTLGTISMWWSTSINGLVWPMNMGRQLLAIPDVNGDEVGEMRNRLVNMCLGLEKAYGVEVYALMWIDDDVIVQPSAMLALAQHDRAIASGVYFTKQDFPEPLIFPGPSSGTTKFEPDEVFESWGWAQGLSLVRTEVYKRMAAELDIGQDKYGQPAWYAKPEIALDSNGGLTTGGTEDFKFFGNANKLGYKAIVDCSKHAFGWHYDLKAKVGFPKPQWEQFWKRQPITWPKKDGSVATWT